MERESANLAMRMSSIENSLIKLMIIQVNLTELNFKILYGVEIKLSLELIFLGLEYSFYS